MIEVDRSAPFFVVMNAGSGRHDGDNPRAIIEAGFAKAGRRLELMLIERSSRVHATARDAVQRARAQGGVIVAAGGDGTINTVAQFALGSGRPFGVLPQGTFNYFGRTHRIPEDMAEAVALLLSGRPQPVQVGLVNDRVFLVNASVGLYPQVLEDREAYKRQFGRSRLVAMWSGLATMLKGTRQMRLTLEHDGRRRVQRTLTLFVGNNRLQLEQIGMPQAAEVERGKLAAIVLRPVGAAEMLWLALRGAFGSLADADNVQSFAFERISVKPKRVGGTMRRVKVATDGEIFWSQTPLEFRVAPEPLWLIKPEPPVADADGAGA